LVVDIEAAENRVRSRSNASFVEKWIASILRKTPLANGVVVKDHVLRIIPLAIQVPANRFQLLHKEALVSDQQSDPRELTSALQSADCFLGTIGAAALVNSLDILTSSSPSKTSSTQSVPRASVSSTAALSLAATRCTGEAKIVAKIGVLIWQ
jgi:hypothetical protein